MSVTYPILTKATSRCFNFGIYLLLLLSSTACSTIDLGKHGTAIFYNEKPIISPTFSKLPELPTDHDAILARVEGSFDSVMQFVRPYRMIAEPVDPSYPLNNVPSIYMFERVGTVYNDSPTFSSRLVEPEQEHIIVVTDECIGGWSNFGAGWESAPELHYAYNWLFVYFHNTFVQASPYRYFGPGIGLSFESIAIGYEITPQGLAEVYEVKQYYDDENNNRQETPYKSTRVWINAESGTVMQTHNSKMKISWTLDDSITIDPPTSTCES